MLIRTPLDLGAAIRARRRSLGLDQTALAKQVGVRRQWVNKIEAGNSTAAAGLVLRALDTLGLRLQIEADQDPGKAPDVPAGISYDIDAALDRASGPHTLRHDLNDAGIRRNASARKRRRTPRKARR